MPFHENLAHGAANVGTGACALELFLALPLTLGPLHLSSSSKNTTSDQNLQREIKF